MAIIDTPWEDKHMPAGRPRGTMSFSAKRKRAIAAVDEPSRKRTRHQIREARKFFPFLRLPPEIRIIVYSMCGLNLQNSLEGVIKNPKLSTPSILLLNRQIYQEASSCMAKFNALEFTIPQREQTHKKFVCEPAFIRLNHLTITVRHPEHGQKEQFWPNYIAHSTNTVEQVYQWMEKFIGVWKQKGHNLRTFKMEFENDRVLHHLKACHRGCQVRESIRVVLVKLKSLRGLHHVDLTGNVLKFYEKERSEAIDAMTRPALPNLARLPDNVLSMIVGLVLPRTNHVEKWKLFEAPIWAEISQSRLFPNVRSVVSDALSPGTPQIVKIEDIGSPTACIEQYESMLARMTTAHIPFDTMAVFEAAFNSFLRPQFASPSIYGVSRRVNEICRDIIGDQSLVLDQPFMPMSMITKSGRADKTEAVSVAQTISPFMTDQYLQAVRDVLFEYTESFERNWLWDSFISSLVGLWTTKHRLHKITLRLVLDPQQGHRASEKARRRAVRTFDSLTTLRGVNMLVLDGPFKQFERRKLEKMTINSRTAE